MRILLHTWKITRNIWIFILPTRVILKWHWTETRKVGFRQTPRCIINYYCSVILYIYRRISIGYFIFLSIMCYVESNLTYDSSHYYFKVLLRVCKRKNCQRDIKIYPIWFMRHMVYRCYKLMQKTLLLSLNFY